MENNDLQQILQLKELQAKVISFRSNEELSGLMKKASTQQLNQLLNVEMSVLQTTVKTPDPKDLPPPIHEIPHTNNADEIDNMIQDFANTKRAMQLLR